MNEILKAHVTYKEINEEVARRTLENFLDALDPLKIYLTQNEIADWTSPGEELIEKIKNELRKEKFEVFQNIYGVMLKAIERRNSLEKSIAGAPPAEKVTHEEFKDLTWVNDENHLIDRLVRLRTLQSEAAEKLEEGTKDQFFQRLTKRRLSKEQEIICDNPQQQHQQMLAYVLKAFTGALDSYTSYFTPSEAQQFMIQVQQRLFGIGAQLRDDLNGFTIVRIVEGGPAEKHGEIKIGDRIIAVNGEPVVGLDIIEAVDLIRGPKESSVKLTMLRETEHGNGNSSKKFDIEIKRDEIVLNESRFETALEPFGNGVIANLRLFSFYQDPNSSSAEDIKNEILRLKKDHNLLGVILDLRSNPGGLLPQAIALTGLFIKKGIVASIKGTNEKIHHLRNFDGDVVWDGPLIVMINRASASASEIVAQTLQDYGRALIVGDDHTFGKGSYQTFTLETSSSQNVKINPQGEYKVTRGRYYTVSGKSPQLHGTQSDIEVSGPLSKMEIGEIFAKYPLESDTIEPHFEDDLADIHPFHRHKLRRMYLDELQKPLNSYYSYLEKLKENSKQRIKQNPNYQQFLEELAKKESSDEEVLPFGQNDLQQEETFSIMKDLILLNQLDVPQAAGG